MRKKLFLLLLATLSYSAFADTHDNDTVVIKNPQKVTIVTGDSIQKIIVKGKEGDESYEYRNTIQLVDSNYVSNTEINKDTWTFRNVMPTVNVSGNKRNETVVMLGGPFLVGFTAPTHTATGTDFSTFRSWEFALPFLGAYHYFDKKKRSGITFQSYFNWRNYRMNGDLRFTKGDDGSVILSPYPEGATPQFSRIKVFSISGALVYNQFFGKKYGIGFGPMINFNTYASIKTRYKKDGGKFKEMEKDIHQRKVTFDWMGIVYTPGPDFYIKYSPNDVLKEGSVKFRSLTFGLYI